MRTALIALVVLSLSATHVYAEQGGLRAMWAQVERDEANFTTADASAHRHIDAKEPAFAIRALRSVCEAMRHQIDVLDELIHVVAQ